MGLYIVDRYRWTCNFCDKTSTTEFSSFEEANEDYGNHLDTEHP